MRDADEIVGRELGGQAVACHRGCAWCCHQLIVVTHWADGEAIVAAARERMTPAEFAVFAHRVKEQAAQIKSLSHEAAETRRWTCPLLRNGECVVYDVRPVPCRTVVSPDSACCRAMMEADDFADLSAHHQQLATVISERAFRLQIAINDRRPVDGPIELRSLLASILDRESTQ